MVLIRRHTEILDYINLGEVRLYDSAGELIPSDSLTAALSSTYPDSPASNCFDGGCSRGLAAPCAFSCTLQLHVAHAAGARGQSSQPGT